MVNWNMKKPLSYRYCPEYSDKIGWNKCEKEQEIEIEGIEQKKYILEKVLPGKNDSKYNSEKEG